MNAVNTNRVIYYRATDKGNEKMQTHYKTNGENHFPMAVFVAFAGAHF